MIRKLSSFDQSNLSIVSDTLSEASSTVAGASSLGVAASGDSFETANAVPTDYSAFTGEQKFSPAIAQEVSVTEVVEPATMFEPLPEIQQPDAQTEQPINIQLGHPEIPNFFTGPWTPPEVSLKSQILTNPNTIQTDAVHAGYTEFRTERSRTSVEYGSEKSSDSFTAGSVDSVTIPRAVKEQEVERLQNEIEQLLITVPEDQRPYWEKTYNDIVNAHFYDATAAKRVSINGISNEIRYYPRDKERINYDRALEELTTFLEQLKAVQQPTQVAVDPEG